MSMQSEMMGLLMQSAPSGDGMTWTLGKYINSSGVITDGNFGAYSSEVFPITRKIRRKGESAEGGAPLTVWVHEYANGAWLRRANIVSVDQQLTLLSDATSLRFTFQFQSSSGRTMTQAIINECFGFEWVV